MIKKDITIRFIPNLLSKEGRELKSFLYDRQWTIRKYIEESGFKLEGMIIIVNGREIENIEKPLTIGDEIFLVPGIEDPVTFAFLVNPAFWAAVFTWLGYAAVAYSIYQAITIKSKKPSFNVSGEGIYEL